VVPTGTTPALRATPPNLGDYLALDTSILLVYSLLMSNTTATEKPVKQMTLREFDALFPNELAAKDYLVARRWPKGAVRCPRCGSEKVYALKSRPYHWVCKNHDTTYRFSLYVGTIFENTNYPLLTWFKVLYLMLSSKKGMSALQIHRMIGTGSYETAWYLCQRLRAGLADPEFMQLMGIVEVDETYIGGKDKNRHWAKKSHITGGSAKMAVIGAIARKGNVVCQVIERADTATLEAFIRRVVNGDVELLATDDHGGYRKLRKAGYKHEAVAHMNHQYVSGKAHTNTIESFWSLIKRGVMGQFHNVSKKYLALYLNEFVFRFNNRNTQDIFGVAVAGC